MDCKKCIPELLSENTDAEQIYLTVQDQLIVGMGGAIALNQIAIHKAMDLFEIEYKRDCFEKVVMLSRHFIGKEKDNK